MKRKMLIAIFAFGLTACETAGFKRMECIGMCSVPPAQALNKCVAQAQAGISENNNMFAGLLIPDIVSSCVRGEGYDVVLCDDPKETGCFKTILK